MNFVFITHIKLLREIQNLTKSEHFFQGRIIVNIDNVHFFV